MQNINCTQSLLAYGAALLALASCSNMPATTVNPAPSKFHADSGFYIELSVLPGRLKQTAPQIIPISYDHYFKSAKSYQGYDLLDIINPAIKENKFDTANAVLVFECTDDYKPMMRLADIYTRKGYLVFKDLAQTEGKNWADSIAAKFKPWYLVWQNVGKDNHSYAWPYGLKGIRLKNKNYHL